MNDAEKKALLGICLVAAFADGEKTDGERKEIQRVGDGLELGPLDAPELYEHAATGMLSIPALAASFETRETRLLAYEMALGVCESDAQLNAPERTFLQELQQALNLDDASIQASRDTTRQLQAQVLGPAAAGPTAAAPAAAPVEGVDRIILEHAILCGALELLPETLATMAILPTQMKMVYQIGRAHGVTLDRGHIKEFFVAAGVGLTSQVVEGYASKLAKGLLGRVLGGVGRAVAGTATGAALSFATTYALGHVAHQYYAGGRKLTQAQLRAAYDAMLQKARQVQSQHTADIQACSRNLRVQNLLPLGR
ncbi:MAG TPA: GTPase [Verrucomicrobiota bacterium]|nr:GTPase [Verrucomicrobiota bacterium]HNU52244.1 GTPase [Verrucomicrobiota bacterium]